MVRVRDFLSSQKNVTVTIQNPQETLQGTPTTLPTSEPSPAQISYTVASSDLPSFTVKPDSVKYIAIVFGAGKVVTAPTLSYRMKKNGNSVATGSGPVTVNYYYTWNTFFYDVVIGDVLELALWSNKTNSNWDYKALSVCYTRFIPKLSCPILSPFNITQSLTHPTLTLGNPSAISPIVSYIFHDDLFQLSWSGTSISLMCIEPESTVGLFKAGLGDDAYMNQASISTSPTYRPYYRTHYLPSSFNYHVLQT
jgi:hypothetical protein